MHRILALFLFFLPLLVNAQKPGTIFPAGEAGTDYNVRDAKGKRQGPWIRVYKENPKVLYYRGQFATGVPTGVFEYYSTTGDLTARVDHVQDSTINDVTYFHPDGKTIMSQGRYTGQLVDGKWTRMKQGSWKMYDASGVLRAEENYTDNLLDGTCRYLYSNGKLVSVFQYKRGVLNGPFTEYYETGKKEREGQYLNDSFEGAFVSYHASGMKESEGQYIKGFQDGTWHFYTADGVPEVDVLYKMGKEVKRKYQNGTFTHYYDNGIPQSEYSYEDGKKNGPFREWYNKGQFVQVPGSREDAETGILFREKLEGTQLKVEGDYLDDQLEGEIIYYTEKGTIDRIEVWSGGKLVETRASR